MGGVKGESLNFYHWGLACNNCIHWDGNWIQPRLKCLRESMKTGAVSVLALGTVSVTVHYKRESSKVDWEEGKNHQRIQE